MDLIIHTDSRYLYYKISSIDANFKLSNRDSTGKDPGLSTGHAYFVPDKEYKHWIGAQGKQTEVRCPLRNILPNAYVFSRHRRVRIFLRSKWQIRRTRRGYG